MRRVAALLLILGAGGASKELLSMAWPLRAFVTDLHGKPVAFSAVTLGGQLIMTVGGSPAMPMVRPLARGDTVHATTPAQYPLDLKTGPVAFFTAGRDSIRIVVGRNPFGWYDRVGAEGRHLTAHLTNGGVVIDTQ